MSPSPEVELVASAGAGVEDGAERRWEAMAMREWGKYVILFQEAKTKSKSHNPYASPKSRLQVYQKGVFKKMFEIAFLVGKVNKLYFKKCLD